MGAQATHSATITDDDQALVAFQGATSATAVEVGNHAVELVLSVPAGTTPTNITVDVTDVGSGNAGSGSD